MQKSRFFYLLLLKIFYLNFCFPFFDMSLNQKKGKPHRLYFHLGVICSIYETVSNVIWETHSFMSCLRFPTMSRNSNNFMDLTENNWNSVWLYIVFISWYIGSLCESSGSTKLFNLLFLLFLLHLSFITTTLAQRERKL